MQSTKAFANVWKACQKKAELFFESVAAWTRVKPFSISFKLITHSIRSNTLPRERGVIVNANLVASISVGLLIMDLTNTSFLIPNKLLL